MISLNLLISFDPLKNIRSWDNVHILPREKEIQKNKNNPNPRVKAIQKRKTK